MVNGAVDHERSNLDAVDGVHLAALADVAGATPELVARHADGVDIVDSFMAFNLAYGTDGAVVRIDADVDVAAPIHIVDIVAPGSVTNASSTGVVIQLGERSAATVVETRLGAGAEFGGSNVRTTIDLAADARLEHLVVQDLPAAQVHLGRVDAVPGRAQHTAPAVLQPRVGVRSSGVSRRVGRRRRSCRPVRTVLRRR